MGSSPRRSGPTSHASPASPGARPNHTPLRGHNPKPPGPSAASPPRSARHFGKSPELLGTSEVRSYLLYLTHDRHVASSTYNQALCALKFLYRITLREDWGLDGLARTRRQTKLPVVLSLEEVTRFFEPITS